MQNSILKQFGTTAALRVDRAKSLLQRGDGILLVDDEDRENEGDLIFAAESLTEERMAMLIRYCSGIVCLCLPGERVDLLGLPQMVHDNNSRYGTAFTVSIEARDEVTTGVSAADRVKTIQTAIKDDFQAGELVSPGHVFPLRAAEGGVRVRPGHTEGALELMQMAGLKPAAVLCELTNDDGTMARLPEIVGFALEKSLTVVSIEDLLECSYMEQAA